MGDAFGSVTHATVTCCMCLAQPASVFGGHVTRGAEKLFAGWCRACIDRLRASCCARLRDVAREWTIVEFVNCDLAGWCGHWTPEMGARTWEETEALWLAFRNDAVPRAEAAR